MRETVHIISILRVDTRLKLYSNFKMANFTLTFPKYSVYLEKKTKKHIYQDALPEQVSSSYEQRRAGSPQQRPTVCCALETAGYQYRDPDRHRDNEENTQYTI